MWVGSELIRNEDDQNWGESEMGMIRNGDDQNWGGSEMGMIRIGEDQMIKAE